MVARLQFSTTRSTCMRAHLPDLAVEVWHICRADGIMQRLRDEARRRSGQRPAGERHRQDHPRPLGAARHTAGRQRPTSPSATTDGSPASTAASPPPGADRSGPAGARHAQCALPRLPARHRRPHRACERRARRQLLDLAGADVPGGRRRSMRKRCGTRRSSSTASLRARGYTSVAEFHYVHRLGGSSAEETAEALIAGGAGGRAAPAAAAGAVPARRPRRQRRLSARQQGFGLEPRRIRQAAADACRRRPAAGPHLSLGIAPHSLRAVGADDLGEALKLRERDPSRTARCTSTSASRWPRWRRHATSSARRRSSGYARTRRSTGAGCWSTPPTQARRNWQLARDRQAVVCVCTTTEANLGDGPFDIERWWQLGGALAIGSDSNVGLDPAEELRWLEYQARLRRQRRTLAGRRRLGASRHQPVAPGGGRRTPGVRSRRMPASRVGAPAELLEIRLSDRALTPDEALDDLVFAQRATARCRRAELAGAAGLLGLVRHLVVCARPSAPLLRALACILFRNLVGCFARPARQRSPPLRCLQLALRSFFSSFFCFLARSRWRLANA